MPVNDTVPSNSSPQKNIKKSSIPEALQMFFYNLQTSKRQFVKCIIKLYYKMEIVLQLKSLPSHLAGVAIRPFSSTTSKS
jgi:hypothetical protein